MAQRYRREVENLRNALDRQDGRGEAAEPLRGLIEKIVLTPEKGRDDLRIDLHGDLAGILSIASRKRARPGKAPYDNLPEPNKIALVAGVGLFAAHRLSMSGSPLSGSLGDYVACALSRAALSRA